MTRWLLVLAVAACSTEPCPTVAQVTHGATGAAVTWIAEVEVERCQVDGWADPVRTCVARATTDAESNACLDGLTLVQSFVLDRTTGRIVERIHAIEKHATIAEFRKNLSAFDTGILAQLAECRDYRAAIERALEQTEECARIDVLELFGLQQQVLGELRDLMKRPTPDEVRATCRRRADHLRSDPQLKC